MNARMHDKQVEVTINKPPLNRGKGGRKSRFLMRETQKGVELPYPYEAMLKETP